ncbi:sigma-54-dependent Fis family transcriptional regulator [Archangium gephyra]|nr:sigma-54-dependent Fis family transcriptional regulator [Archangium gephyra]
MRDGPLEDQSTFSIPKVRSGEGLPRLVPALTLISHPATHRVGERLLMEELLGGAKVELSRMAPEFLRPGETQGAPLANGCLSRKPIVFAPGEGGRIQLFVEEGGTRVVVGGAPVVGGWEFGREELSAGIPLELADRVVLLLHMAESEANGPQDSLGMVGQSPGIRRVREHIRQVAGLQESVLIRGETGTGKELVAQAIHDNSPRRQARFVDVNMAAIPRELAEAELFGVRRGAFSGAIRERDGRFRVAQGGTLFLDEVGEMPPEVQVKLLRVLEQKEVYPVGSDLPVPTDVRLVAATDANLEAQSREGRFKEPLKYRLAKYEIRLPPLRERREDIGLLFFHFARQVLVELGDDIRCLEEPRDPRAEPWLPASLAARLVRAPWPGNIRQLHNLTRQLVIASRGKPHLRLEPTLEQELGPPVTPLGRPLRSMLVPDSQATPVPKAAVELAGAPRRRPADISEQELRAALRANSWDLKKVADQLGIPRPSIYDLLRKYNIRTAGDLSVEEIIRCYHECKGDLDAMVPRLEVSKQALRRRIKEIKELELGA